MDGRPTSPGTAVSEGIFSRAFSSGRTRNGGFHQEPGSAIETVEGETRDVGLDHHVRVLLGERQESVRQHSGVVGTAKPACRNVGGPLISTGETSGATGADRIDQRALGEDHCLTGTKIGSGDGKRNLRSRERQGKISGAFAPSLPFRRRCDGCAHSLNLFCDLPLGHSVDQRQNVVSSSMRSPVAFDCQLPWSLRN